MKWDVNLVTECSFYEHRPFNTEIRDIQSYTVPLVWPWLLGML